MTQQPPTWHNPNQGVDYSEASQTSKLAIWALVLGVFSFFLSCFAGIPAIILGIMGISAINKNPSNLRGKALAIVGLILGIVTTALIPVIALLIAILLPSLGRAREMANRANCTANLMGMMKACIVYASDNNDAFPLTVPTKSNGVTSYDTWRGSAPTYGTNSLDTIFTQNGSTPSAFTTHPTNNPTACLWLLALKGRISPKNLMCKSDLFTLNVPSTLTDGAGEYYQFPESERQISYSLAFPWNNKQSGSAYYWRNNTDSDIALMSDMALRQNPGSTIHSTGRDLNSPNHAGEGQNVAFGDAHVEWKRDPTNVMVSTNDSIFHYGGLVGGVFGDNQLQDSTNIQLTPNTDATRRGIPAFDIYMVPQRDIAGNIR